MKYTKEICVQTAKKYTTLRDWRLYNAGTYVAASKNKWLEECSTHMIKIHHRLIYTKEMCIESARKYNHRYFWYKNEPHFYQAAARNKWIDVCTAHMGPKYAKVPKSDV